MAGTLNKKVLCFVDEYGTAGVGDLYLGAVIVMAREAGRVDKCLSDLLPGNANELHAARLDDGYRPIRFAYDATIEDRYSAGAAARTPSPIRPLAGTKITPCCSRMRRTASMVLARGSTSPRSSFATALRDRMALSASCCWDQPSKARPALICRAVIMAALDANRVGHDHTNGLYDHLNGYIDH